MRPRAVNMRYVFLIVVCRFVWIRKYYGFKDVFLSSAALYIHLHNIAVSTLHDSRSFGKLLNRYGSMRTQWTFGAKRLVIVFVMKFGSRITSSPTKVPLKFRVHDYTTYFIMQTIHYENTALSSFMYV